MYEIQSRVGMSLTGKSGTVKISSIADAIQDCFCFDVAAEKIFSHYIYSHGLAVFVAFQQIDILKYPSYGEHITTKSWSFQMKRYRGTRNSAIYGKNGEVLVQAYGIGVFVNTATGMPVHTIPQEIIESVKLDDKLEMEYLPRRIKIPDTAPISLPCHNTLKYQIDLNQHMNNARYLDVAMEFLPSDFCIKRIAMQYKRAAKYGDILYPQEYIVDSHHIILSLNNQENDPYIIVDCYS